MQWFGIFCKMMHMYSNQFPGTCKTSPLDGVVFFLFNWAVHAQCKKGQFLFSPTLNKSFLISMQTAVYS